MKLYTSMEAKSNSQTNRTKEAFYRSINLSKTRQICSAVWRLFVYTIRFIKDIDKGHVLYKKALIINN
jgi:hypothetical protein